ncbi:MAG: DUF2273 domain-containing protein [Christensenella sp.]
MKEKFFEWYDENRGLFWGIIVGLAIAILFLTIGFWATFLIGLCVGIGAFLGSRPDVRALIRDWFVGLFTKKN